MTDQAAVIASPLIARFEGFRSKPYADTGGVWTIGYGFTYLVDGSKVTASTDDMTSKEGLDFLTSLVSKTVIRVRQLVYTTVNDNQIAAMTSFAYNVGTGTRGFGGSTLLRLLNEGEAFGVVAQQFGGWVYDSQGHLDRGLVSRRLEEKLLFLTPPSAIPVKIETADDLNAAELKEIG